MTEVTTRYVHDSLRD